MNKEKRIVICSDEKETKDLAIKIAASLQEGDVIALIGDLGTGKTTFTRYLARGLDIDGPITSPTFTIVKEYEGGRLPLYHFDVYRITDSEQMWEIGIDDYLFGNGVCVIEWADIIEDILPEDTKYIQIEYGNKENERIFKCSF